MIGNRQGKTEISFDLVEWLSPSDLRDAVQDCPRSFRVTNAVAAWPDIHLRNEAGAPSTKIE